MMEKRQYERTQANVHVKVAIIDRKDNRVLDVAGVLVDASYSGCQLAIPALEGLMVEQLTRGDLLLEVEAAHAATPLKVQGLVRWHNEHPQGARLGVEYSGEVPAQVKLVEQLRRNSATPSGGMHPMAMAGAVLAVVAAAAAFYLML